MEALGMIETMGLIGSIEGADAALKAANVTIINKHYSKAGIVTVEFSGDVGAVQAGVEAAKEATIRLGSYLASHVIPRPEFSIGSLLERKEIKVEKIVEKVVLETSDLHVNDKNKNKK
ncbi:MAG: BMC domain-containing protein [Fusobacteriaceae bacterium]